MDELLHENSSGGPFNAIMWNHLPQCWDQCEKVHDSHDSAVVICLYIQANSLQSFLVATEAKCFQQTAFRAFRTLLDKQFDRWGLLSRQPYASCKILVFFLIFFLHMWAYVGVTEIWKYRLHSKNCRWGLKVVNECNCKALLHEDKNFHPLQQSKCWQTRLVYCFKLGWLGFLTI
jgi:hypothetical protein